MTFSVSEFSHLLNKTKAVAQRCSVKKVFLEVAILRIAATHLNLMFYSIPPENERKHLVSEHFQWAIKMKH